ncbi:hypothetical protein T03_13521 [Trichinella britovi]|uniref:DUF5641 domain-containing protein n=1 Tax=Trichinella britovi TaxID=45882 RepID=A0A0V1CF07_TRIBR|nr:hypothetical protein T03_13521 [Trichinella britovi]
MMSYHQICKRNGRHGSWNYVIYQISEFQGVSSHFIEFHLFRGDEKQKIARALTEEKIEWRFSCERSPWCGGYWERVVRSIKTALRKVLAKALVSRKELLASMQERPLTTISDDSNDSEPLTPFHFLTGRTLMELPDMTTKQLVGKESTSTTMTLRRRWYYQRKILRHLWQRWRKEYLVNFNNRRKWKTQKLEPSIKDIVLLCEDGQTRSNWPLGRILELYPSSDGMRSALLKTAAGTLLIEPAAVGWNSSAADMDQANEIIPAENKEEETKNYRMKNWT